MAPPGAARLALAVEHVRGWARPSGGAYRGQTPAQLSLAQRDIPNERPDPVDKGDQAGSAAQGQV